MSKSPTPPEALDSSAAAQVAGVSEQLWAALHARGMTPTPTLGAKWSRACITRWTREEITNDTAASLAGVQPATWRAYVARGHTPAPRRIGRTPVWRRGVILRWVDTRPGPGVRTDLTR